ncbi:MAG: antitoxin [Nitrospirae bacterium]|nr:antitoxin [Nitrospirota bacterium]MBI3377127.1 antitoxin [Nitrospirota bacterium]
MAVVTLRGLDDSMKKAIKEKAKQEGTSINTVLLRILKEDLGLKKKSRMVVHTDLDHLAGTWSDKEYAEFQKRIKDFEAIDEGMWK